MLRWLLSIGHWRSQQRVLALVPVILFSAISLGLYRYWGDSQGLSAFYQQQDRHDLALALLGDYDSPEQVINALKTRLRQAPDSAQGWYLLGRLYMSQQAHVQASQAFAQAYNIEPNDPQLLIQYAQALYFVQDGDLRGEPTILLAQALQQVPDHAEALNLMAVGAYQQGNYAMAIDYWQRILAQRPLAGEAKAALQQAVAVAEKALLPPAGRIKPS